MQLCSCMIFEMAVTHSPSGEHLATAPGRASSLIACLTSLAARGRGTSVRFERPVTRRCAFRSDDQCVHGLLPLRVLGSLQQRIIIHDISKISMTFFWVGMSQDAVRVVLFSTLNSVTINICVHRRIP